MPCKFLYTICIQNLVHIFWRALLLAKLFASITMRSYQARRDDPYTLLHLRSPSLRQKQIVFLGLAQHSVPSHHQQQTERMMPTVGCDSFLPGNHIAFTCTLLGIAMTRDCRGHHPLCSPTSSPSARDCARVCIHSTPQCRSSVATPCNYRSGDFVRSRGETSDQRTAASRESPPSKRSCVSSTPHSNDENSRKHTPTFASPFL